MRAKKCDKCGKFYNPPLKLPEFRVVRTSSTASNYPKRVDLCDECSEKLTRWIKDIKIEKIGD